MQLVVYRQILRISPGVKVAALEHRVLSLSQRRLADPAVVIAGLPPDRRPLPLVAGYDELLMAPSPTAPITEGLDFMSPTAPVAASKTLRQRRDRRASVRRVRTANFPGTKWLIGFDYVANPNIKTPRSNPSPPETGSAKTSPVSHRGLSHRQLPPPHRARRRGRGEGILGQEFPRHPARERARRGQDAKVLAKTIARYGKADLLCIDELGSWN